MAPLFPRCLCSLRRYGRSRGLRLAQIRIASGWVGTHRGCYRRLWGVRLPAAAVEHAWAKTAFQGTGIFSLSLLACVLFEMIDGKGFISACVTGMVFGECEKSKVACELSLRGGPVGHSNLES